MRPLGIKRHPGRTHLRRFQHHRHRPDSRPPRRSAESGRNSCAGSQRRGRQTGGQGPRALKWPQQSAMGRGCWAARARIS
jgi:hypothetical protein